MIDKPVYQKISDETTIQRIRERAYEIWEFRQENNMALVVENGELRDITAQDDWLEAEEKIRHAEEFHREFDIKP